MGKPLLAGIRAYIVGSDTRNFGPIIAYSFTKNGREKNAEEISQLLAKIQPGTEAFSAHLPVTIGETDYDFPVALYAPTPDTISETSPQDVIILYFDQSDRKSFNEATAQFQLIRPFLNPQTKVCLMGVKANHKEAISFDDVEDAEKFADDYKITWIELQSLDELAKLRETICEVMSEHFEIIYSYAHWRHRDQCILALDPYFAPSSSSEGSLANSAISTPHSSLDSHFSLTNSAGGSFQSPTSSAPHSSFHSSQSQPSQLSHRSSLTNSSGPGYSSSPGND
jgi:hypothetical protein